MFSFDIVYCDGFRLVNGPWNGRNKRARSQVCNGSQADLHRLLAAGQLWAKRRLTSLGANIRLRFFEQVIERANSRIEHQVFSIPRFIVSAHYLSPRWLLEAADV
jgi:hypothetical protein